MRKRKAFNSLAYLLWLTVLLILGTSIAHQLRSKRETTLDDLKFVYHKFGSKFSAKISYYGAYPAGTSACSMDPLPPINKQIGWVNVAVSKHDMYSAVACGLCLKISIKKQPVENFSASIIDICSDCKKGEISMYRNGDGVDDAEVKATDCPDVVGENGYIRFRIAKTEKRTLRIQVKNTKLPIVGFEIYHEERWHCFERDADNYFTGHHMDALQFPATVRVTSITGQLVGFSIEKLEYDKDVASGVQLLSFSTTNKGIPAHAYCLGAKQDHSGNTTGSLRSEGINDNTGTKVNHKPELVQGSDQFFNGLLHRLKAQKSGGYSQEPSNRTEAMINLRRLGIQVDNNTTAEQQLSSIMADGTPARAYKINSSYCKGKFDGSYVHPIDCEKFLLCSRGRTFVKMCPMGLRFNQVEGLCDWPRHVNCGTRKSALVSFDGEQVSEPEKDEEVYTRKFENRKTSLENIGDNV